MGTKHSHEWVLKETREDLPNFPDIVRLHPYAECTVCGIMDERPWRLVRRSTLAK